MTYVIPRFDLLMSMLDKTEGFQTIITDNINHYNTNSDNECKNKTCY